MARTPEFKNDFVIDTKIYNKSLSLDELVASSKKEIKGFEPHFISFLLCKGQTSAFLALYKVKIFYIMNIQV